MELTDEVSVDPFTLFGGFTMSIEVVGEYTPIEFLEVDVLDDVGEPTTELRIGVRFDAAEPHAVQFSSEVPF